MPDPVAVRERGPNDLANDYITKPTGEAELPSRVLAALALRRETEQRKARERDVAAQLRRALVAERALTRANALLAEQAEALTDELERRERAEAALSRKARVEGALLVARTVAHKINNALSPVVGFAVLMRTRPGVQSDDKAMLYAGAIGEAGDREMQKIRQMQMVTRREKPPMHVAAGSAVLDLARASA